MPGFSDFAGFAGVVEITGLNTSEFLYYLDELYGNELVFAFSVVSSNNTDVETTEQFIVLCLLLRFSYFWPTMNSLMPFKERSFALRLFAYFKG